MSVVARLTSLRALLLLAPNHLRRHFLEEGPGFVTWFNQRVTPGITSELFWIVNVTALAITAAVIALEWVSENAVSATMVVAWVSFLMLANAVFHVASALADRTYVPGLVTALVLYVPFSVLVLRRVLRTNRLPAGAVARTAVLGALPMLIHGYLIVFRGSRFF